MDASEIESFLRHDVKLCADGKRARDKFLAAAKLWKAGDKEGAMEEFGLIFESHVLTAAEKRAEKYKAWLKQKHEADYRATMRLWS